MFTKKLASTTVAASLLLSAVACEDPMVDPEDPTTFLVTIENVSTIYDFLQSGVFNTPVGAAGPGPLLPGATYEFSFAAGPGSYLSFATMMVQSNDWFYAPDGMGIALYEMDGTPVEGDVTDQLYLWDAGSEEDQEPGLGMDQAPRQSGPNTGAADDDTTVRLADDIWGNVPANEDVIEFTLEYTGPYMFTARIKNVSDAMTLMTSDGMYHPVPMAPGVYVVHTAADPLFTVGADERGEGLAAIAEDGDASALGDVLAGRTGVTGPISPGAYAVSTLPAVIFSEGDADLGIGLEAVAEDGDPSALAASLAGKADVSDSGAFNTPEGAAGPAPAFPGESYSFEVMGTSDDVLHVATMFVQSNDLFLAPSDAGIELFTGGSALSGDITSKFMLWDAGTEVNQFPGIGSDQAPRQAGPNTGADEGGLVREVDDGYAYPDVADVIRVTITPMGS